MAEPGGLKLNGTTTAISTLVAVFGLAAAVFRPMDNRIASLEIGLRELSKSVTAHHELPGHVASLKNQEGLREMILDNRRGIVDLGERFIGRMDRSMADAKEMNRALDTALQREMRDLDAADRLLIEQLERRIDRLEGRK